MSDRRPLRVLRVVDGCHAPASAGRMVISGRMADVCAELDVGWHTSDVDADPELRAEYGDRVPVILIDGREHGFWAVEEPRLRAALTG